MTTRTRSRRVVNASIRDAEDSDELIEDGSSKDRGANAAASSDLFVDPLLGHQLIFYVHEEVEDRSHIVKLIRVHGGGCSSSYTNATYLLVDPLTVAGQNLNVLFHNNKKGKTVLDATWIQKCVDAGKILAYKFEWAGCKVTGKERDEYLARRQEEAASSQNNQAIPPLDAIMHESDSEEDEERDELQDDQTNARGETPTQRQQEELSQPGSVGAQPEEADANRPAQMYYPSPLLYGYGPPRPGGPMPWPYMAGPVPVPMPMHMHMPMFTAPSPGAQVEGQDNQTPQAIPIPPNYPTYDYQQQMQALNNQWIEYYGQMGQMEEAGGHQYHPLYPQPEGTDADKRRRGRTRTRNPGPSPARLTVKPTGPPARSPSPPTRVVRSTYGGNLFTDEDIDYLKRYIAYCQAQGLLLSLREICERLAIKAPHHTFFSWRRYCNKHQIRLGAYTMEGREEDAVMDDDGTIQVEGAGSSSSPGKQTNRSGSPAPPKILYKSTTGKGVAFTPEDVQYLLDYMEYRTAKSVEPLDMVEFWNDLAEKAPHHSRASWMKYWRRHRHELVPSGNQPVTPAYVAPTKKSRYTRKDDILLAKFFGDTANTTDGNAKKTSDVVFQEFATQHPHHPWKGWQEHYRLHKHQIDHMIKQLEAGEELS